VNVCFLNRSYWPDTGATGQLLTELAEDLAAHHGMKVTVVTGPPLGANASIDLPRRQYRNGVDIIRARGTALPPRRFAARATNYLTYFAAAFIAARRLPPQDVVIALTDPPVIGLAALAARRERPFVVYCQDVFPEVAALLQDFRSPTVDRLLERVNRLLLRRANAVVALGETMATRLVDGKGADRSRISIIHNWADTTAIVPDAQRNPFSEAHGLAAKFVVLHAGNIGQSQNLDSVIDAADELRHCDDVVFVFIGDGTGRESLQAAAVARGLDNVRFIPYQPREHLRWTYATASVFVVSLKPGLAGYIVPSKLYGILASGRPYIAAVEDESEVAEITRRHDCGIQIAPGNARAMARAVLALKDDPARREAMGARARDASTQFDRRRQVAAHAALLRRVSAESAENAARGVRGEAVRGVRGEGGPRRTRRKRSAENGSPRRTIT
jgi:glycosyltransferase involved in cell wall biosynthesis